MNVLNACRPPARAGHSDRTHRPACNGSGRKATLSADQRAEVRQAIAAGSSVSVLAREHNTKPADSPAGEGGELSVLRPALAPG
jgi:hypothetical protein